MQKLNSALAKLTIPDRMQHLPVTPSGFIVPWFVAIIDGVADFRVIGPGKIERAVREQRCWLCGGPLGRFLAFVIGPMCAVNRISAEPPSHADCALFAVRACPFLTRPKMHRREHGLPEDVQEPAGIFNNRNPGVALVWVTRSYRLVPDGPGVLFRVGVPEELHWFAEGRPATRTEVLSSMESGLAALRSLAEEDGEAAVAALGRAYTAALALVPAAMPREVPV